MAKKEDEFEKEERDEEYHKKESGSIEGGDKKTADKKEYRAEKKVAMAKKMKLDECKHCGSKAHKTHEHKKK
jgi:hypothetical protein